ncbi:hypothetical protein [Streptomyces hoynatensis]|uniref:Uncharacterized protein n=1 Tax=Streptomyces hoynatensis TaxID=1141874 RepID=A0A3A9YIU4_9ACTN|nr:hypothetical protein [Streptomyces hoynatensis]RKN36788.1 hypothetical protein D7294_29730 [Streptomyces hoynatensis]
MAGRTDPPEGTPGGAPGAGDEEYQSIVFDESFVRAARLQEFSAQERLEDHTTAVRRRSPDSGRAQARAVPKQGIALALIILLAFAAAIYLGNNNPYASHDGIAADPPAATVILLAPEETEDAVRGSADPEALFAQSPAADYGVGEGGVSLPDPRPTEHFSREQVLTALTLAKEYVVASALNAEVLAGATTAPVRELLGADQEQQFDAALDGRDPRSRPVDWLVRFDPDEVALAANEVRVDGEFTFGEISEDVLQVTGRHVFAYAVRPAGVPQADATLFTLQRDIRLEFGDKELRDRNVVLRQVDSLAGPIDCAEIPETALRPLLAGEVAGEPGSEGTDPYDLTGGRPVLCGTYAAEALTPPADRQSR